MYDRVVPSVEWAIMCAPERTYGRLVVEPASISFATALRRPLLSALLIGATMATTATGLADAVAVFRTTTAWSFAIMVQIVGAAVLVGTARRRPVPAARAFDLLFAANGPWSLWLVAFTAWTVLDQPLGAIHGALPTLLLPAAWTAYLVFTHCRLVLGETAAVALRKAAIHQASIWVIGAGYFFWAVQGWPRIIGWWAIHVRGV